MFPRHKILAELIAKRLTAEADDTVTLAGNVAVDVIGALSPRQIRVLGMIAMLYGIRPSSPPTPQNQEEYDEYVTEFWDGNMSRLLDPDLLQTNPIDFSHLQALSCLVLQFGVYMLPTVLSIDPKPTPGTGFTMARVESKSWWPIFQRLWELGVQRATLTSIGSLIGTLYRDEMVGGHTAILWDRRAAPPS